MRKVELIHCEFDLQTLSPRRHAWVTWLLKVLRQTSGTPFLTGSIAELCSTTAHVDSVHLLDNILNNKCRPTVPYPINNNINKC